MAHVKVIDALWILLAYVISYLIYLGSLRVNVGVPLREDQSRQCAVLGGQHVRL